MQMILLMKALHYSAGVSLEWNVSMSLDPWSDFPRGRGRVVMLALTAEIQPVQWKWGWQLEKIHSQSERSAEAGMPTFQSSDRSTLGSVPGHSWLNARPGGAHSKAHLSSSQLWSMEPLGSSFIVQYGTATNHSPTDAGDRWQWRLEGRWWKTVGLPVTIQNLHRDLVVGHKHPMHLKEKVVQQSSRSPLIANQLSFVNQSWMQWDFCCFA